MKRINIIIITTILSLLNGIEAFGQTDTKQLERAYIGDIRIDKPYKIIGTKEIEAPASGTELTIKNPFPEIEIEITAEDIIFECNYSWIKQATLVRQVSLNNILITIAPNTSHGRKGNFLLVYKDNAFLYHVKQAGNGTIDIQTKLPLLIQNNSANFSFKAYTDWEIKSKYSNISFSSTSGSAGINNVNVSMSEGVPSAYFDIYSVDGLWKQKINVKNIGGRPIISEIRETTDGLFAIELFNPTMQTLRLNFYGLTFYDESGALATIPLTGAIGSGQVFVITSPIAPETFRERAHWINSLSQAGDVLNMALTCEDLIIDYVDLNYTNRARISRVNYPSTTYNASEWHSQPEISGLGTHFHNSIGGLSPSTTENYVMTQTPALPVKNENELNQVNLVERRATLAYVDGLGRADQEVAVAASPGLNDVVSFHSYDDIGREYRTNLPFTIDQNHGGGYIANAENEQLYFYENKKSNAPTSKPFADKVYDGSPLNRVLKQGAPGSAWQPVKDIRERLEGEHIISNHFSTNAKDEVSHWRMYHTNTMVNAGYYAEGTLYKNITRDENNNISITFKDFQGKVILKRQQDSLETKATDTYYVYDDFGRLRFVIPPATFSEKGLPPSGSPGFGVGTDWVDQFCYHYRYDDRGRMIYKKLPGAEPVLMVYDNRDRLVLTQDGNQRPNNEWNFIAYDQLNREVTTGYLTINSNEATVRNTFTDPKHTTLPQDATGNYILDPLVAGGLSGIVATSKTYYDNYTFPGAASYNDCPSITEGPAKSNTTSMVTGGWERIGDDETSQYGILTTTFYDDYGRMSRQKRELTVAEGQFTEYSALAYNFRGDIIEEMVVVSNGLEGQKSELILRKRMSYDHVGNMLQTDVKVDGMSPWVTTSEMTYNEIGELITKKLGNGAQKIDFSYNIRGWLTSLNDVEKQGNDLFAMTLAYNNPSADLGTVKAQYNGNISGMKWLTTKKSDVLKQGYAFDYDHLNRLESANYVDFTFDMNDYSVSGITYDKNGNIKTLVRQGSTGTIDELTYAYKGNQLLKVDDTSDENIGVPMGTRTSNNNYDDNGNLTFNAVRNMNLTYNRSNLPKSIDIDGKIIRNYFSASGIKILKKGESDKRYYIGAVEITDANGFEYIHLADGRIRIEGNRATFDYALKDHLGNTRAMFTVDNKGVAKLQQSNDYYPFGMRFNQSATFGTDKDNKYLYNGKELQMDYDLNWYDYGARFYDPAIARWSVIDNKAEKYYFTTPYTYALNNPLFFVDPDGNDVKVSIQKDEKSGKTIVNYKVTMSVTNKSRFSNKVVMKHATGVAKQIEKSFSGYDANTNTEYKTNVSFDKSEKNFKLEFTHDIEGGKVSTTGKVDEIGNTKENRMQVALEKGPGKDGPLQTTSETSQIGAHEFGHTVGLRHGGEENSVLETSSENNLMNYCDSDEINLKQLEKAKQTTISNQEIENRIKNNDKYTKNQY